MGAKEVAAGAQWLDENFPGWEREIDLGNLRLSSCTDCILGQSLRRFVTTELDGFQYGYLVAHRQGLAQEPHWVSQHGFAARAVDEALWVELIKERFATGNLSDTEDE